MEINNLLMIIMSTLVIVELLLTYGIFKLKAGLTRTREAMDDLRLSMKQSIDLARESTNAIKLIAKNLQGGEFTIESKQLGKIEVTLKSKRKKLLGII
ncbi:MAG: hypothetical protein ABIJ18_05725 [archaeon]